ncbi:MAG: hypothetical protein M1833_005524 [Piccolia ochrophora]|nr:MAG: hypothetical protein M1833_005524 [Piccolia ochrophora]
MSKRTFKSQGSVSPPRKRRAKTCEEHNDDGATPIVQSQVCDQFRVFSWNVNGIGPVIQRPITAFFDNKSGQTTPLRSFLKRHKWPDILCLQEIKINSSDKATQRVLEKAVNNSVPGTDEPRYVVRFSLPRDKYNARGFGGKVYGVATIIRDDLWSESSSCREVDWDLEGRVLVLETRSKLAVFNIYAVNGTENPYRDPETGAITGTRHDRKRQFHAALLKECQTLERAGFRLIVAGDMNIAREQQDGHPNLRTGHQHVTNRADFNRKFFDDGDGLRALDSFRYVHGNEKRYTYHPRGREWGSSCDRVDLILLSRDFETVGALIVGANICDSPQERGPSDHVPLYVALERDKLRSITDPPV